jgi:hypothetical protein
MHHLLPQDIAAALDDLSPPRLASYRTFFRPKTDAELYGIYCWNDSISTRFMRLIGTVEITMRNRFHRELSRFAYVAGTSLGTPESNDWYRFVVQNSTNNVTAKNIKKVTGSSLISSIPAHKVVAGMTYGFWPHLMLITHTAAGAPIPWDKIIPRMLPDHHGNRIPAYWTKAHNRDKLFTRLRVINDFRNRIAHFEPLWKFSDLKSEWTPSAAYPEKTLRLAPVDVPSAIERLQDAYRRTTQVLHWFSKARAADYMLSENHHSLDWLFSEEAVEYYRNIGKEETFRLGSLTKSWGAKLELSQRKSILITNRSIPIGRYYALSQPKKI